MIKPVTKVEALSIKDCLKSLGVTEATANIFILPKFKKKREALNKP